jgi:hypothetical protein
MTRYCIRAVEFANGLPCPHAGQWLKAFDFDAHDGQGHGVFTNELTKAKPFPDQGAALEFWKTQSRRQPLREDGKPNRPLTALTISVERMP